MKSAPRARRACASTTLCATSQPPSTQSVPDTRRPSATEAGSSARSASNTASGKRMRFSSEPPNSSSRWLDKGDKNSCSK